MTTLATLGAAFLLGLTMVGCAADADEASEDDVEATAEAVTRQAVVGEWTRKGPMKPYACDHRMIYPQELKDGRTPAECDYNQLETLTIRAVKATKESPDGLAYELTLWSWDIIDDPFGLGPALNAAAERPYMTVKTESPVRFRGDVRRKKGTRGREYLLFSEGVNIVKGKEVKNVGMSKAAVRIDKANGAELVVTEVSPFDLEKTGEPGSTGTTAFVKR